MNHDPFKEYIRESEPDKRDKGYAWHTAIGLQAVDGLRTSEYLVHTAVRNIEGEISFKEANALLQTYYEENPAHDVKDRTEEADKVSVRIAELLSEQAFSFTPNEYISIHRKLFIGIYPHAGRIRDYNITKKEWVIDGATVIYGSATELRATLDYDFSEEKKFSYRNLSMDEIIRHLALFVSRLWQIHVFGEGNTRTTAVFFIKYLRTLGFDVTNDIFAENAWYFRNALVRANYNDLKNGIHETTEYLELFLRNLLLNEHHPLQNRILHISGTFKETEKPDIEMAKPDIEERKADIEKLFQPEIESYILKLREAFPGGAIFRRSDVMKIIDIKPSRASELLKKLTEYDIIELVSGHGKGKYRFKKEQEMKYIAHRNEISGAVQTVKEHCEKTAALCRDYAVPELKDFMYAVGMLHDVGKFQESFVKRINGANIKVEHSGCGAIAAKEKYAVSPPMALMMEYCIAGHHSGIPNGGFPNDGSDQPTLCGRLKRDFEDFSEYKNELVLPELNGLEWMMYLLGDCDNKMDHVIDKFAFLTRYAFSCLVDADSTDTADFCKERELPRKLKADFSACLQSVDDRLNSFVCKTGLQKARAVLQNQAFQNIRQEAEIYLLNMPTGSGKTLASVKIALERALAKQKKRIIYIIPYNSIIEQTADVFEELFGDNLEILRHQSTFSYEEEENGSEDYREAAKTAAENWDAPFIITTAVQFFESVYANKRGKLRKMHNMSDSILIFDEAHLMPQDYLQPCLQAVAYITRYLHSEAVFLTATMPDFEKLIKEYALPDSKIVKLIKDTSMFAEFQKCRYRYIGGISSSELLSRCREYPSSLIIVNKKATARELYQECGGKRYHLSTYMTSYDRKRILKEIRQELKQLEADYPEYKDVPEDRRITIISTSLIEAGVDLDVYTVFRERTGLDSILQAGGRCNREGKRKTADVFIFDRTEETRQAASDDKASLTKGLLKKYEDISDVRCIEEYYSRLYFMKVDDIQKNTMHQICSDLASIPFKEYAEKFEFIDSRQVSLVVPRDAQSEKLVETMKYTKTGNARKLQNYTCSVTRKELEDLIRQHAADDYGTGIYCLTNKDYYDEYKGVLFEAPDYFL